MLQKCAVVQDQSGRLTTRSAWKYSLHLNNFLPIHQVKMCLRVITHVTPFLGHKEGDGIFINSRSLLRMRLQRAEVLQIDLKFEMKSQRNTPFADWVTKLLSDCYCKEDKQGGHPEALSMVKTISKQKKYDDLDFLISHLKHILSLRPRGSLA